MDTNQFIQKFSEQFEDAELVKLDMDTIFRELPTWDSMTAMCVQTMIFDDYGVNLPDDRFKELTTVRDVVDFLTNEGK